MLDVNQVNTVISSLRQHSYAIIENAVSQSIVNEILAVTASPTIHLNSNELTAVIHGKTQFFTNIIAHSRTVHNLILSPFVLNLCTTYLGANCRLVNNRVQTTRVNVAMPWHTDNNQLKDGRLVGRHDMPGLQFVLYLTNVSAAPFQLIKDSHKWSLSHKNQYILDSEINSSNHEIIELIPRPGSLLILNTHVFHRAAPIKDSNYMRSILLFQADSVSTDYPGHGEKLYVNPEYFSEVTPQIISFLGLGRPRAYPAFPETSVKTLELEQATLLWLRLFKVLPRLFLIRFLKRYMSSDSLVKLKIFSVFANSKKNAQQQTPPSSPYL